VTRQEMEARRFAAAKAIAAGVLSSGDLCLEYGITRTTLSRWRRQLNRGGLGALQLRKATGRRPRLRDSDKAAFEELWKSREWTIAEFRDAVKESLGVSFHRDHLSRLLIQMKLRPKRSYRSRDLPCPISA
jgi:putative transposase